MMLLQGSCILCMQVCTRLMPLAFSCLAEGAATSRPLFVWKHSRNTSHQPASPFVALSPVVCVRIIASMCAVYVSHIIPCQSEIRSSWIVMILAS
jgi:hypothetical protein